MRRWPESMLVHADGGIVRPEPTSEHHRSFLQRMHEDAGYFSKPFYAFEIADCARNSNCFEVDVSRPVREYELACFNSYNALMEPNFDALSAFLSRLGLTIEYHELQGTDAESDVEILDARIGVIFGHWEVRPFLSHLHSELQLRLTTIEYWIGKKNAE